MPTIDETDLSPAQKANWNARVQIDVLERQQARAVREFILGDATAVARLKAINDQIVALRPQIIGSQP